jgi:hypothetical protein
MGNWRFLIKISDVRLNLPSNILIGISGQLRYLLCLARGDPGFEQDQLMVVIRMMALISGALSITEHHD